MLEASYDSHAPNITPEAQKNGLLNGARSPCVASPRSQLVTKILSLVGVATNWYSYETGRNSLKTECVFSVEYRRHGEKDRGQESTASKRK